MSKESDRLWAASVDMTKVLVPFFAERRAVAAARVVFPTPPFPVKSMMRIEMTSQYLMIEKRNLIVSLPRDKSTVCIPGMIESRCPSHVFVAQDTLYM